MKILIAVDGSRYSEAALDEVARRTCPKGSEILIVHAVEVPLAPTTEMWALPVDYYQRLHDVCLKNAEQVIKAAAARLSSLSDFVKISTKVIRGSPKSVILHEAETWQPDLIVVGSHGYPKWEQLLIGSVSQAIVSHAKCSVEVVKLPPQQKAA